MERDREIEKKTKIERSKRTSIAIKQTIFNMHKRERQTREEKEREK